MFRGQYSTVGTGTKTKDERKKQKIGACAECHRTKSKCYYPEDSNDPRCARCVRLGIKDCIPHMSRQGKKRKKSDPLPQEDDESSSTSSRAPNYAAASAGGGVDNINLPAPPFGGNRLQGRGMAAGAVPFHRSDLSNPNRMSSSDSLTAFFGHALSEMRQNNLTGGFGAGDATNGINGPSPHPMNGINGPSPHPWGRKMLLGRACSDNSALVGNGSVGGGDAANQNAAMKNGLPPLAGSGVGMPPQTTNFFSNMDAAKLNMIASHLANSNTNSIHTNNKISDNRGANTMGNHCLQNLNNHKLPPSSVLDSDTVAAEQTPVSALLMLAGTSSSASAGNASAMINGNGLPTNLNSGTNNPRGVSDSSSNTNNVTGGLGGSSGGGAMVTGHNNSGHARPPQSSPLFPGQAAARQEIGRTDNQTNNDNSTSQPGMNAAFHTTGPAAAESSSKKQKRAHPLPSAPATKTEASFLSQNAATKSGDNNDDTLHRTSSTGTLFSHASSASNPPVSPADVIGNTIASARAGRSGRRPTNFRSHHGLQCQVREWISIALVRRSFALLGKASSLAHRCGIHMDRILCGVADDDGGADGATGSGSEGRARGGTGGRGAGTRMSHLLAALLEPRSRQKVGGRMLAPRLSREFLNVVGCTSCPSFDKSDMENRWIWIREVHKGVSRFYCSPAFERNVLRWVHIAQIYEENLADIASLMFTKADFRKLLACNAHQILLHSSEGMPPRPVHAPKIKIRLLGRRWAFPASGDSDKKITKEMIDEVMDGGSDTSMMEMDVRFVSFPTMDKTTYYVELFHHSDNDGGGSLESLPRDVRRDSLNARAVHDCAAGEQRSVISSDSNETKNDAANSSIVERNVSENPPKLEEPPALQEIKHGQEFVGIDDMLENDDHDDLAQLITLLLD